MIVVLITMIYFTFFLHDYVTARIILNKQVNELAYLADYYNELDVGQIESNVADGGRDLNSTEDELKNLLNTKMILCNTNSITIEINKGLFYYSGSIIADINIDTAFSYVNEWINGSQTNSQVKTKATYIRGNKMMIPLAAVNEISDKVTEIGEVKKKYVDKFNEAIKHVIEGKSN